MFGFAHANLMTYIHFERSVVFGAINFSVQHVKQFFKLTPRHSLLIQEKLKKKKRNLDNSVNLSA